LATVWSIASANSSTDRSPWARTFDELGTPAAGHCLGGFGEGVEQSRLGLMVSHAVHLFRDDYSSDLLTSVRARVLIKSSLE